MKCDVCKTNEAAYVEQEWNSQGLHYCEECAIEKINAKPYFYCTYCEGYTDSKNAIFVDSDAYCCGECALANYHINKIEE